MPRRGYDIDEDVDDDHDGIVTKQGNPHQEIEDLAEWADASGRDGVGRFMPRHLLPINSREGPMLPETPEQREARQSGFEGGEQDE